MMRALIFIPLLFLTWTANASPVKCVVTSKQVCAEGGVCTKASNPTTMWNIIDLEAKTFSRCDKEGCDVHDAIVSTTGSFGFMDLVGKGGFIKFLKPGDSVSALAELAGLIGLRPNGYVEVVTQFTNTYVSHGICDWSE